MIPPTDSPCAHSRPRPLARPDSDVRFDDEAPFEIGDSQLKGWTFTMNVQGSSVCQVRVPKLVELWKQGSFPCDTPVKTYPFTGINQVFEDSAHGTTIERILFF